MHGDSFWSAGALSRFKWWTVTDVSKVTRFFITSVTFHQSTRRNIREDLNLQEQCCEELSLATAGAVKRRWKFH